MGGGFDDEAEAAEPTISIQEYLKDVEEQELVYMPLLLPIGLQYMSYGVSPVGIFRTFLYANFDPSGKQEVDLVLGGDEGKECTYSKGYLKRQAIFSCLTCTPDGNTGVCTACSLSCHDGHEIVELWTKRNFRCDCGNSKFGEVFCKIFPNKDTENSQNAYNHNFKGLYCTCLRPYPDPNLEEQVEMIQCCLCEDWFHEEHLGLDPSDEIPRDEEGEGEPLYEDFICKSCSAVCSFLSLYPPTILSSKKQSVSILCSSNGKDAVEEETPPVCGSSKKIENGNLSNDSPKMDSSVGGSSSSAAVSQITCVLGTHEVPVKESGPLFLSKNWRDILCRCGKCLEMYDEKRIGFLLDKEDTIMEYERMAKEKREEKLQQQEGVELNMLNDLGHVQKMEILSGIADMKDEMRTFLESFDSSKPITTSDIHQVFENLAKKRRRE